MALQRPPFTALAAVYDAIMADIEYAEWAEFVLHFLREEGAAPRTLLDLACGTGNSAVPFLERGLEVTGIDASPEMLSLARTKLPAAHLEVGTLTHFELAERFDLVTCLFDSLNNLLDPAELRACFAQVRAHLQPGGWLVADVNTRLGVRELWEGDVIEGVVPTADGREVHYHWSHSFDPETELGTVQAFCRIEGEEFVEYHTERGYDPPTLEELLRAAGFARVVFAEYPDYAEPDAETPRVWLFAQVTK
ncbi:SAM-dependent methyltransferase [Deinobacterium chartae]|uniref:SAM-dependent methyltransferase n=1 Tax=Deinobacterium chartae TaxID=521158 RepID=A0A841I4A6_9DEIO|nr:class I SAM-dependent methyltransferase [Deinobacterium chartae]MBB6098735.1 SAM-dependent methyltransferase [Deinobacterium chartae]